MLGLKLIYVSKRAPTLSTLYDLSVLMLNCFQERLNLLITDYDKHFLMWEYLKKISHDK